jgi:putative colanic acid biosynthesis glycosyltransferase
MREIMGYKVSIITVTFNCVGSIRGLYESLLMQGYRDFEWVVVDGMSTDGTIDFLSKVNLPNFKYISEKDDGIYDAMNKAIRMCSGDYINFMGADDIFADCDVLQNVSDVMNDSVDVLVGVVKDGRGVLFGSSVGVKTLILNTIHHQSAFYSRKLFNNFLYDKSIKVVSDYELNLLIYLNKFKVKKINKLVAICGADGISNNVSEYSLYRDMMRIRSKYMSPLFSRVFFWVACLNVLRKRFTR